jgi:hypothetical protein
MGQIYFGAVGQFCIGGDSLFRFVASTKCVPVHSASKVSTFFIVDTIVDPHPAQLKTALGARLRFEFLQAIRELPATTSTPPWSSGAAAPSAWRRSTSSL